MPTVLVAGLILLVAMPAASQTKPAARQPAPPASGARKMVPDMSCPATLGQGVTSVRNYCDVVAGRDPAAGILIKLPPHRGPVTLTFDLHNRHTYSEEQVKAGRAFAQYTATIGVLTMDNTLISRAVVQSEFRTAADLVERVAGGAGPGGVKAVAPTGTESITILIPDSEDAVSILGEKLTVERLDGSATYTQEGRPIATISNVMIEYRPGPPRPAPRAGTAKPTAKPETTKPQASP
jgi:hypothetical protein